MAYADDRAGNAGIYSAGVMLPLLLAGGATHMYRIGALDSWLGIDNSRGAAMAAKLQQGLPRQVDEVTTLTAITGKDNALIFDLKIAGSYPAGEGNVVVSQLKQMARVQSCADPAARQVIADGVKLQRRYTFADGKQVAVSVDYC